jgi:ribosomal subunit interface protein
MHYNLKGTGVPVTDELRDYIEKKLSTLDKFVANNSGARTDVEVAYLASEEKQYRAELLLHDKQQLRTTATGSTLHEAIDSAAGELAEELSRAKKKRLHTFRHNAFKVKEYLRGWRKSI